MKLIDANALKTAISNGAYCKYCDYGQLYGCGDCDRCSFKDDNIQKLIDDQPDVKTETAKHGHWIFGGGSFYDHYCRCSACDEISEKSTPFCPWCGVIMHEE